MVDLGQEGYLTYVYMYHHDHYAAWESLAAGSKVATSNTKHSDGVLSSIMGKEKRSCIALGKNVNAYVLSSSKNTIIDSLLSLNRYVIRINVM